MQKITIKTISSQGVESSQSLIKVDAKPVRVNVVPGSKIFVEIDGLVQPVNGQSKPNATKDVQLKKTGQDLIIQSQEGEALVEIVDFYVTENVSVAGVEWAYVDAGIPTKIVVSPEALALDASREVLAIDAVGLSGTGASDASTVVGAPNWMGGLVFGGLAIAAAASGGASVASGGVPETNTVMVA